MARRSLAAVLALLLHAGPAAADGATQALAAVGAAANFGICLFLSAQIDEQEEEGAGEKEEAQEAREPYSKRGLVAGIGASAGVEYFDGDGVRGEEASPGLAVRAGFRCTRRLSSELAYEWMEGFDIQGGHDRGLWTLTSNGKFHLLTGRWQPFALLGLGILHGDVPGFRPRTDVAARFGGGIDVFATRSVAVSVDASYVAPTGNVQKLDYVSAGLGLQYHF